MKFKKLDITGFKSFSDKTSFLIEDGLTGIVGPNGAGKTTFIKTLLGEIPLNDGFVNVGETIRFGYYSQTAVFADDEQRVFYVGATRAKEELHVLLPQTTMHFKLAL